MARLLTTELYDECFHETRKGSIVRISDDEIILFFTKSILILKLDAYCETIDIKCPYKLQKLCLQQMCFKSILSAMIDLLQVTSIHLHLCRNESPKDWHHINEISLDALFLEEHKPQRCEVLDVFIPGYCSNIDDFIVSNRANLIIFLINDNQSILCTKRDGKFEPVRNLSQNLLNYLAVNLAEFCTSHAEKSFQSSSEKVRNLADYFSSGKFIATKFWLFPKVDVQDLQIALSIQRDESVVLWLIDSEETEPSSSQTEIFEICKGHIPENSTSCCLHFDESAKKNYVLVGTSEGNVFGFPIIADMDGIRIGPIFKLIGLDDNIPVFHLFVETKENSVTLIAARHSSFLTSRLDSNPENGILFAEDLFVVRSTYKLPIKSLTRFGNNLVAFCREAIFQCDFDAVDGVSLSRFLPDILPFELKKEEPHGFCFSSNLSLAFVCSGKISADKYSVKRPYTLSVVHVSTETSSILHKILYRDSIDQSIDDLIVLRYAIHRTDRLPNDVENFVETFDPFHEDDIYRLQVTRFLLKHILLRASISVHAPEEDWQSKLYNVELRLVKCRAMKIKNSRCKEEKADKFEILLQNADQLINDNMLKLNCGDSCPVCNSKDFTLSETSALTKICSHNHTIALCPKTLLAISGCKQDKCSRCHLFANSLTVADNKDIDFLFTTCSMCGGQFVKYDFLNVE